ncbi:MAG: type II secretion system minor pseudopilin GspI [Betaproteobacteria bacterium]|jgi:general secretion pathway protein I|nr:MAG: type II secretion system minor pseudopilin GspI [Betaproteobacteria bacterium]
MKLHGFTLVEVLVALAIVATALLASIRAVGEMASSSRALELRLLADMSAQNRIAEVRAAREFLSVGTREFACPQGTIEFVCREDIKPTPNTLFRRIEVRVYIGTDASHHYAEVVGIIGNETGP